MLKMMYKLLKKKYINNVDVLIYERKDTYKCLFQFILNIFKYVLKYIEKW